ncbi:MAG: hypothetical protein EOP94_02285, partial [Zymomonas sp.]
FHHRMEEAYSAADLAIARSGAASLTELSHFALPSVLIPYPHAAEDHQTLNAEIFDTSQDISPTQYGTIGIESALALKYIYLLRGQIEQDTKTNGSLRVAFPSIEADTAHEQAAA